MPSLCLQMIEYDQICQICASSVFTSFCFILMWSHGKPIEFLKITKFKTCLDFLKHKIAIQLCFKYEFVVKHMCLFIFT